jgi:hypothetical protein
MAFASSTSFHRVVERHVIERHRLAFFEADGHRLGLDGHVFAPGRHAHDGLDDAHVLIEMLQVLGFVRGAPDVGIGGVSLLHAHLVSESVARMYSDISLRPPSSSMKFLIEPGLVNAQRRIGQQTVAVEALDIVALERAAVAPDVDVVLFHGDHQHGAGDGAADGRGIEVMHAGGRDVEGAGLQRGDALGHQLLAAIDEARFSAPYSRARRGISS